MSREEPREGRQAGHRTSVLVTVPTGDRWIHTSVAQAVERLVRDGRCRVDVRYPRHRPYEHNLHHCVQTLRSGPWSHWLNIDADNPPTRNPLDLLTCDVDIIGLPTPVWHCTTYTTWPWYFNAYAYDPESDGYRPHPPGGGLTKVDAIGTGCFLMRREVFDHPDLQTGAFQRLWNRDGTVYKGNDLAFSERARQAGFDIHTHYGYPCDHHVTVPLLELVRAVTGAHETLQREALQHA